MTEAVHNHVSVLPLVLLAHTKLAGRHTHMHTHIADESNFKKPGTCWLLAWFNCFMYLPMTAQTFSLHLKFLFLFIYASCYGGMMDMDINIAMR